ncbi:hypothetical protein Z046_08840 [Pseudomonas aeruginosa VRFPA09]|nr:hypothetical protein Z046_08840 [Pseudomonas aeruginosa VRFPA09]
MPPITAPNTPVIITKAAVSSGTPPRSWDISMANGVVIERGSNDSVTWPSSARAWASAQELPMATAVPANIPASSAGQWRISSSRCCQIGMAKATVAGPSSATSQLVSRA